MMNYLDEFQSPSSKFRGAPFWAWNSKLDKETLLKQVEYFKEMGLGGFTMHCRTGMATPYMSEEFLDLIKACVNRAKELDMKAYLYDEDRWPSGFGGGEVTKEEQYRARCLVFTPVRVEDRKKEEIVEESSSWARGRATENGKLMGCYRVVLKDGCLEEYKKLTKAEEKEARKNGETIWYAYLEISPESPWYNNETYVNTLDKKAIERFIETTHEKYLGAVGEEFGGVIPSIFTDEPQFVHKQTFGRAEDLNDVVIPYTDDYEDTFKKQYGESFLKHLPEVFWELPEGNVSLTRYHYHDHLAERFACAFADTLGDWCDNHGIALTGHMMEEPTLRSQTAALGEAMRHYRGFKVPGIDILCDSREYTTAKQAQSAAHQLGANEVTSELYGVTNWDFDFRGHKLQGDWQAALGVTHRVQHLSWVSMAGEAKRDYPASIFYQSPWYKKYSIIEDYFGRVNTALMSGAPKVRIGVIHPVESYWLSFGPDEQTAAARNELETHFKEITEWLLFGLQDFDYISEALLTSLKDSGGEKEGFAAGCMNYDVVLVPGLRTMRSTTVKRLEEFAAKGGRLVFMGDKPSMIDAVPAVLPEALETAECIGFDCGKLMNAIEDVRLVDMRDERGVRADRYLYQMREIGEDRVLFLADGKADGNPDIPNKGTYTVTVAGEYEVTVLDAMTGEKLSCDAVYENGNTVVTKALYEHDSLLLYLKKPAKSKRKTKKNAVSCGCACAEPVPVCTLNVPAAYRMSEPNVLLLDQAEYALDGEAFRPCEEVLRADNVLRTELGWPLKMDAIAQPWTEDQNEVPEHTLTLRYVFESKKAFENVMLAMEYAEDTEVILNGVSVPVEFEGYFTDECIRTLALPKLKKGENELILRMPYMKKGNVEWSYLLGNFGVRVIGNRAKLVKKPDEIGFSDLAAQGFPFFAGNMTYECRIDVPEGDYAIETTKFRAPLVTVSVDGGEEKCTALKPYRADLGHLSGKHTIRITAYGSRVNAFGAVHLSDEVERWCGPNAWRTRGSRFSYEYQLKRIGLLSAPVLLKY